MENIITIQCYGLDLFMDNKKRIRGQFIYHDNNDDKMTNVISHINEQINEIYGNIKITEVFLKRLEYKLKLVMRLKPVKLTFVNQKEDWILQTKLEDIYHPVILTHDGTKMGDNPLLLAAKVSKLVIDSKKVFLECTIKELDLETNFLVEKIKRINIDNEINSIYKNKECNEKFKRMLVIGCNNKQMFVDALSRYFEGKTLEIEYDEHKGYSLWTVLENFIDDYIG